VALAVAARYSERTERRGRSKGTIAFVRSDIRGETSTGIRDRYADQSAVRYIECTNLWKQQGQVECKLVAAFRSLLTRPPTASRPFVVIDYKAREELREGTRSKLDPINNPQPPYGGGLLHCFEGVSSNGRECASRRSGE
jgi:hypothetical protein